MAVLNQNRFTFKVSASISFKVWFHESQNQCQFSKQTVLTRLHEPEWWEKHFKNSWPDIPLGGLGYVKAFWAKLMPHTDCWPQSGLFEASFQSSACKWDQTRHNPKKMINFEIDTIFEFYSWRRCFGRFRPSSVAPVALGHVGRQHTVAWAYGLTSCLSHGS